MIPTQERLGAHNVSAVITLRLVIDSELPAFQRDVQVRFHAHFPIQVALHCRVEKAQGVSARGLGLIERHLGVPEHAIDRFVTAAEQLRANAGTAVKVSALKAEGFGKGLFQPFRHSTGTAGRLFRIRAKSPQEDHELVTTKGRQHIVLA